MSDWLWLYTAVRPTDRIAACACHSSQPPYWSSQPSLRVSLIVPSSMCMDDCWPRPTPLKLFPLCGGSPLLRARRFGLPEHRIWSESDTQHLAEPSLGLIERVL